MNGWQGSGSRLGLEYRGLVFIGLGCRVVQGVGHVALGFGIGVCCLGDTFMRGRARPLPRVPSALNPKPLNPIRPKP